jgi:hypothetical protein
MQREGLFSAMNSAAELIETQSQFLTPRVFCFVFYCTPVFVAKNCRRLRTRKGSRLPADAVGGGWFWLTKAQGE